MKCKSQRREGMSTRRDFIGMSALAAAGFSYFGCEAANAPVWQGWEKGHFQVHFLYTGVRNFCKTVPFSPAMLLANRSRILHRIGLPL